MAREIPKPKTAIIHGDEMYAGNDLPQMNHVLLTSEQDEDEYDDYDFSDDYACENGCCACCGCSCDDYDDNDDEE